jgi:hypothetical protein
MTEDPNEGLRELVWPLIFLAVVGAAFLFAAEYLVR